MSGKKPKADLAALFKLEFYRKQSNWKFCSQVLQKNTKGGTKEKHKDNKTPAARPIEKPVEKCLNKTYFLEAAEDDEESVLNEAFVETYHDKNISTPQNSPISPAKNWTPEFIKTSDNQNKNFQSDEEPITNSSQKKPTPINSEENTSKRKINLLDQFKNTSQNRPQKEEYNNYAQDWLEPEKLEQIWPYEAQENWPIEKEDQNVQKENDQNIIQDGGFDQNLLRLQMMRFRRNYIKYEQQNRDWQNNVKVCPKEENKIMQSWANIASSQSNEKYPEINNNNTKVYTEWSSVENSELVNENWQNWKNIQVPQNTMVMPQYTSIMPQYTSIMPQYTQNMPTNTSMTPENSSFTPQNTPNNWPENFWQNEMLWQEWKGLPEIDKNGYEGSEAGWPRETQIWTNHNLCSEAIWSEDVLRELELLNAQELDPAIPVAGEKWVPPDRLLQWMLANKECCDDVLETSCESEEQFMRGAHCAPHSSDIDIQPQVDALDSSDTCLELPSLETVSALSECALRAVGRAHARALRRVADELRAREQRSRSNGLPTADSQRSDISCEEYPTRDIGLHQPIFIDTFISGSYKNNPMRLECEKFNRGQIGLNKGQIGLNKGQIGLNKGQIGLVSNQPGSYGDFYLIGKGRGRLPIKEYQIQVGRGRGRI